MEKDRNDIRMNDSKNEKRGNKENAIKALPFAACLTSLDTLSTRQQAISIGYPVFFQKFSKKPTTFASDID